MTRRGGLLAAAAIAAVMALLAWDLAEPPRHNSLDALPGTLWALACAVVIFGVAGLPVTRLALPASLREREWLWVLPVGACVTGMALTLLGLCGSPLWLSLVALLATGAWFSWKAVQRHGWPSTPRLELLWAGYLAVVVLSLAVMPMLLKLHFLSVTGVGSDAHMAAGTADFLQHAYPLGRDDELPVERMPALWRSKYPIYYAFGAVSELSGLESWQVLVPLIALLLALAGVGMYLVAREVLGAPMNVALVAGFLVGANRISLHTALNPYFNQLWGYFAVPFALVLGWHIFKPEQEPRQRWRAAALFALFMTILLFAYPLAAPVVLIPVFVFFWLDRRARKARGEQVPRLRDLYRGKRDLIWIFLLIAFLGQPLRGVQEKFLGALKVLGDPEKQLIQWAGDLLDFIPEQQFYSLPVNALGRLCALALLVIAVLFLRRQPRALGWGLGAVIAYGLLFANYFRQYEYGWYFHFKILAYVAPLIVLIGVVGLARWRRFGPAFMVLLAVLAIGSVRAELQETGLQLGRPTIELEQWAGDVPRGASIRLDMHPPQQLWAAYFLAERRLCSEQPLLETDYPHVVFSRKADYIVTTRDRGRPADAVGARLRFNEGYELYEMNPVAPGKDRCSQAMQSRVYED